MIEGDEHVRDEVRLRVIQAAEHILETGATVRACAGKFGVSKTTIHKDMRSRLPALDGQLSAEVDRILKKNLQERHLRGGDATRRKFLQLREEEELSELGFEMEASFRGRGFMKEALEAVMIYAREELELDRLRAVVDVDNAASQHVCRSLGFAEAFRRQEQGRQWIFFEKEIGI